MADPIVPLGTPEYRKPSFVDYLFGLTSGYAPSGTRRLFHERDLSDQYMKEQQEALRKWNAMIQPGGAPAGAPQLAASPSAVPNPSQDPSSPPMLPGAPAGFPAAGGAPAQGGVDPLAAAPRLDTSVNPMPTAGPPAGAPPTAAAMQRGFYNSDGVTLRSYQDLSQDPAVLMALQNAATAPKAKELLELAYKRRPEYAANGDALYDKNTGQYLPERRSSSPNETSGLYQTYDPATGRYSTQASQNFNLLNAEGIASRALVNAQADLATKPELAGRVAGAEAQARAPFVADNRQTPSGAPVFGVLADRFGGQGGQGAAPQAAPQGGVAGNGQLAGAPTNRGQNNSAANQVGQAPMVGQSTFDKTAEEQRAKDELARSEALRTAGAQASQTINNLNHLTQLGRQFTTGTATPTTTQINALAQSFGINLQPSSTTSAAQAYSALASQIAMGNRTLLPGPMSDSDRQFLLDLGPSAGKTPGANKIIIDSAVKAAERQLYISQMRAQWDNKIGVGRNNSYGDSFDTWVDKYNNANPLFPQARNR